MKLHHTTERLRKRAALDVAKKLRLEPRLAKNMRRVFRSMVNDFRVTYARQQETIIPLKYKSDVVGILRDHYRRVIKAFNSATRDELKKEKSFRAAGLARNEDITDSVNAKLGPYTLLHSERQASLILQTTHDGLQAAIDRAAHAALTTGEPIDSTEIADIVSRNYLARIGARADVISVTETQSMAEKTKKTELEELQNENDADDDDADNATGDDADQAEEGTGKFDEVWVSILDNHTRPAHAEADGQVVSLGDPFIVGGEELQYPGDPNGSLENIIECRCCSVPVAGGDSLREG